MLPIGGLYITYHLLREPETAIETMPDFFNLLCDGNSWGHPIEMIDEHVSGTHFGLVDKNTVNGFIHLTLSVSIVWKMYILDHKFQWIKMK